MPRKNNGNLVCPYCKWKTKDRRGLAIHQAKNPHCQKRAVVHRRWDEGWIRMPKGAWYFDKAKEFGIKTRVDNYDRMYVPIWLVALCQRNGKYAGKPDFGRRRTNRLIVNDPKLMDEVNRVLDHPSKQKALAAAFKIQQNKKPGIMFWDEDKANQKYTTPRGEDPQRHEESPHSNGDNNSEGGSDV